MVINNICLKLIGLAFLGLSIPSHAAIQSADWHLEGDNLITRDTVSGLEWLDVTETRGLSYSQVINDTVAGGVYEGWRYATSNEFDQLIFNFGYEPLYQNCAYGLSFCDTGLTGDSLLIESMIHLLGDIEDAYFDQYNVEYDVPEDGAGYTRGMLIGPFFGYQGQVDLAFIQDSEVVDRNTGLLQDDRDDKILSHDGTTVTGSGSHAFGSFLVRSTVVPLPSAIYFMGSALLGLASFKRSQY